MIVRVCLPLCTLLENFATDLFVPLCQEGPIKILSEEDILDGGMVYFDGRLEGLSKIYDFKHLYNRPINSTEEI